MRVTLLALGCLLILGTVAQAIPVQNGTFNSLFFNNNEVWLDGDSDNLLSIGDVLWGTLTMQSIEGGSDETGSGGSLIWGVGGGIAPPKEITGYFITQVVGFTDQGGGNGTFAFAAPSTDPNGIISNADLAAGVVLNIYEDTNNDYSAATQGSALTTATDGSLLWKLTLANSNIVNSTSADAGYWFSNVAIDPFSANPNELGDGFAALNVHTNNSSIAKFGLVTDPTEQILNRMTHFWFNTELSIVPDGLTSNFAVGADQPMHFFSNDPGVYKPIPEPGTLALFGLGLAGALYVGRRRRLRTK